MVILIFFNVKHTSKPVPFLMYYVFCSSILLLEYVKQLSVYFLSYQIVYAPLETHRLDI